MGDLLNAAIYVGPVTFLAGLGVAVVSLLVQLTRPDRMATLRRALKTAGIAILGFGAGAMVGIAIFCSSASGGNLCGLGGVFGLGPFTAGLCLGIRALTTLRSGRAAE
jgi:hypothetical protein